MKKILMPILMILFVVGGAVAADFMKTSKASTAEAEDSDHSSKEKVKQGGDKKGKDSDGKKKSKKDKKSSKKSKDGDEGQNGSLEVSYLKFKRQFVVPVMKEGKIDALIIMNLNYELNSDAPENVYTYEPKLRDAIMRELLGLSRDGVFGEGLTSADSYEKIRNRLLGAGQAIIPEGIRGVLILDIARQEQ